MRHGSLFSGIGGFDLAAEWVGWENVFQVENDEWCQKVLIKNFPNVKKYKDIKDFNGAEWRGRVNVISGGFPCQPFSQAGKRQGKADDRYLWPEMLRVISEAKPSFVVGENVAGLLSMENGRTLERILFDLENEGYQVEVFVIPACAVGAWHRRDRVWIVAYTDRSRRNNSKQYKKTGIFEREISGSRFEGAEMGCETNKYSENRTPKDAPNPQGYDDGCTYKGIGSQAQLRNIHRGRVEFTGEYDIKSAVCRKDNGLPDRVDCLKGLGNAIVPQVAYELFKTIDYVEFH